MIALEGMLHLAQDGLAVAPKATLKALFAQLALHLTLRVPHHLGWRAERTAAVAVLMLLLGRGYYLGFLVADDFSLFWELALKCVLIRAGIPSSRLISGS